MKKLRSWLLAGFATEIKAAVAVESAKVLAQQAKIIEQLTVINKSLAQLALAKSKEPEELTNAQRAALLGLPEQFGEQIDWTRMP